MTKRFMTTIIEKTSMKSYLYPFILTSTSSIILFSYNLNEKNKLNKEVESLIKQHYNMKLLLEQQTQNNIELQQKYDILYNKQTEINNDLQKKYDKQNENNNELQKNIKTQQNTTEFYKLMNNITSTFYWLAFWTLWFKH